MAGIRGCPLRGLFSENKEWRGRLLSSSANLPTVRDEGTVIVVPGTADNGDRVSFASSPLRTADRALHESLDIRVEVAGEVELSCARRSHR